MMSFINKLAKVFRVYVMFIKLTELLETQSLLLTWNLGPRTSLHEGNNAAEL